MAIKYLFILLFSSLLHAETLFTTLDFTEHEEYNKTKRLFSYGKFKIIESKLVPIGWSKDDKFAYIIVPPDEAHGFMRAEFVIQNMLTDKILFKRRYDNSNDSSAQYPTNIINFMRDKEADINASLREHHINRVQENVLQSFPIILSEKTINIANKMLYETNAKGYLLNEKILSEQSISLFTVESYIETFREKIFSGQLGYFSYESLVLGYIPSPFNDSIAVILAYIERGYEGPPHTIHFQIIGASISQPL